jgi:RimJ/RimL family protein N-acetyltransferase
MAISFRPLAVTDLENVVRWMLDDDVQRWWYPEGTSETEIRAEYEPSTQSESHGLHKTARYIVDVDGHDIGLAQWHFGDYPEYASEVQSSGSVWVDVLIGLPEWRNRGLGSELTSQFVHEIVFADPTIQRCAIDPDPENGPAIRAYEKAGFRHARTYRSETDGLSAYLMVLERPLPKIT